MKKLTFGMLIMLLISACSSKNDNYLVKFHEAGFDKIGAPSGYLNSTGDTVIPIGKYDYCYTDTIRNLGMVIERETGKILGIDQNATELFEVFNYDNGPDYVESGLFRIIKNGRIGYANPQGEIIIEPGFECAYPFEGNFAQVADTCKTIKYGEYSTSKSGNWYQITKQGKRAEK
jgi:hypothetical protein